MLDASELSTTASMEEPLYHTVHGKTVTHSEYEAGEEEAAKTGKPSLLVDSYVHDEEGQDGEESKSVEVLMVEEHVPVPVPVPVDEAVLEPETGHREAEPTSKVHEQVETDTQQEPDPRVEKTLPQDVTTVDVGSHEEL